MDLAICSDGSKDGGGERRPGHVSHHTVEVVAEHWVTGDHRMAERERERERERNKEKCCSRLFIVHVRPQQTTELHYTYFTYIIRYIHSRESKSSTLHPTLPHFQIYSGTSEQGTLWGQRFCPCIEFVLISEIRWSLSQRVRYRRFYCTAYFLLLSSILYTH